MKTNIKAILYVLSAISMPVSALALTGSWRGELSVGPSKLPLVFNFDENAEGKTHATMDSPQQNARDIPLDVLYISQDSLSVECRMIGARYNARIGGGKIDGTFTQQGHKFPLTLTPERSLTDRRPQTPVAPFPYTERDTVFTSADGTQLAGTLTIPESVPAGMKKCPVVVMVTGSGPQNRDEEIFEHRPFAVIADYLARNGIASFRYDDRGVASSGGDYAKASIDSFKADARSAYRFVRQFREFGKAGILGHSEGGTLAMLIAAEDKPDFIVSLAGMVTPSRQTLLEQNARALDRSGITGAQRDASLRLIELMYDRIIGQYTAGKPEPIDVDAICRENALDVPAAVLASVRQSSATRSAYFDSLVSLDPTPALRKVKCPVLAINGSKDTQVNPDTNLEAFRANVKRVDIRRMEGLNHLMQHATTGDLTEYGDIAETISPEVLQIVSDFILRQ